MKNPLLVAALLALASPFGPGCSPPPEEPPPAPPAPAPAEPVSAKPAPAKKQKPDPTSRPGASTGDAVAMEPWALLDDRLTLALPASITQMAEERMKQNYPRLRRPEWIFSNADETVIVEVNESDTEVTASWLARLHESMENSFRALYPDATWHRSEMTRIGDRRAFVLEFTAPRNEQDWRNTMLGTHLDGRLLTVTYRMRSDADEEWMGVGRQVIEAVRVVE